MTGPELTYLMGFLSSGVLVGLVARWLDLFNAHIGRG